MRGYEQQFPAMTKGHTHKFRVTVKDINGTAVNISSWTAFRCTAKDSLADTDAEAVFAKTLASGITKADAANGIIEITVAAADTALVAEGMNHELYIDVTGVDGTSEPWVVERGMLPVYARVSRTTP